jgi:ABC-type uncharacterized transport system substrate-binding protein
MRRRELLLALAGAMTVPCTMHAQQKAIPVIGFLSTLAGPTPFVDAFREALKQSGYSAGDNLAIEFRWANGDRHRLQEFAADLVRRKVTVIVAAGGDASLLAAKAATATIPIVFINGTDPLKLRVAASLNRPDGNITGQSLFAGELEAKRLEMLRQLLPRADKIAVLINPTLAATKTRNDALSAAALTLGLGLVFLRATTPEELDAALARAAESKADGLFVRADAFFTDRRDTIVRFAASHAIPAIYGWREFPITGGLISYGTSIAAAYRRAGNYAGRLLRGAKLSDLPIEQPTRFELVINLKAAKALGLTVPQSLLARADEVIE